MPAEGRCDAFGYDAFTLDGLIAELQKRREQMPDLADKQVYYSKGSIKVPVTHTMLGHDKRFLHLTGPFG